MRRVTLVFDRVECPFYPTGEVVSCVKPTKPKLNKEQKEKLQSGEAIPVSVPRIELAKWQVAPSQNGFATITPFTSHQFLLPAELLIVAALDANPICLNFVVEYQSWTQKTMLAELRTVGNAVKLLQKTCEHYRTEVLSGNLNKSRRMFGLPEVKTPTVKASAA